MTPVKLTVTAYITKQIQAKQQPKVRRNNKRVKPSLYGEVMTRDDIIDRLEEEERDKKQVEEERALKRAEKELKKAEKKAEKDAKKATKKSTKTRQKKAPELSDEEIGKVTYFQLMHTMLLITSQCTQHSHVSYKRVTLFFTQQMKGSVKSVVRFMKKTVRLSKKAGLAVIMNVEDGTTTGVQALPESPEVLQPFYVDTVINSSTLPLYNRQTHQQASKKSDLALTV